MTDGVSNEPVIASTPAPISVEPRTASPIEVAETARQAEEAKLPADAKKAEPAAKEPVEKPKLSTREAIRAAAAKVEATAEKASPIKVAEPAPVVKEAKAEPVAAKDAPAAKADGKTAEPVAKEAPARAEDGKFVSTKPAAEPVLAEAKAAEPAKAALPSHTASPAPARFSAAAKEEWASLPETSRSEMSRMEKELNAGFEKYKTAAARDADLAEFHEMAGKSQKNLKDVVAQYVGMEQLLRTDLVGGLELIAKNAGFSLRDVAAKIMGQTPEETAASSDKRVIALETELADLKKSVGGITAERETTRTTTTHEAVTKFAADHPRFEELSEDIAFFLKTRTKDLAEAYSLAERLNPAPAAPAPAPELAPVVASSAPPAAVPAKPTLVPPTAQPRDAGNRSITGTPTAGSDPVRKQPSNSIKEALQRAKARAG